MISLESLFHDLRSGVRALRSSPGFVLSAFLILALGIGSATAVFTVVDGLLLRPLPVSDPGRIVRIWKRDIPRGYEHYPLTYPEYLEWSGRARGFDSLGALWSWSPLDGVITGTGEPRRVHLLLVSWNVFDVLGVSPVIGRSFDASDETASAVPPLVLSHHFFRSLGGDPSLVGRTLRLHYGSVTTFQVIGVLSERFDLSSGAEAWTPVLAVHREWANGEGCECDLIGRLGREVDISSVRAELQTIHEVLAKDAPDRYPAMQVVVTPLLHTVVGDAGPVSLLALGAVALLVTLAAVNVAGLSLMRAARKRRDLAIRVAMGADGRSLVRQQLAESFILCLMGLAGGLAVARLGVQLVLYLKGAELPRVSEIALDGRGVVFSVALLGVTALGFALFPAIRASRVDPVSALKHKAGGGGDGRLMSLMVVGEVALAVVLLFGAALFGRTLLAQQSIDRGFRSEGLLTVAVRMPQSKYPHPEARLAFLETAVEAIERLPGVVAVTPIFLGPGTGWFGMSGGFLFEGQTEVEARANPMANFEWVTPSYFRTLGIPLIRGRTFTQVDRLEGERVAVVSQGTAERYWPGENPIGKTVATGYASHRVVGVVGDTRYRELTRAWQSVYFPLRQNPFSAEARLHELGTPGYLAVRARLEPYAMVPAIRSVIRSMDGEVLLDEVATMESLLDKELAAPRFNALLTGFFSVVALLLAATGLFGILATSVNQRLFELGVRLALGATPTRLQADVLRRGSVLVLAGVLGGSVMAFFLSGLIRRFLYGVGPWDPATFAGVITLIVVAATVATYVPALRASRADPVSCLRQE